MTQAMPLRLGVLILGAGASRRMGRAKLLLPWGDTSIIGHLLAVWRDLGAAQIAVVLRPDDTALAAELDRLGVPQSERITNPEPERGMFSSIRCAADWPGWHAQLSQWAVVLGDQPHLRPATLQRLMAVVATHPAAVCQPAYAGRAAHPVILPRAVFAELRNSQADNLKEFLKLIGTASVQVPVEDPGLALDLDTPQDYIQAQASILSHEKAGA